MIFLTAKQNDIFFGQAIKKPLTEARGVPLINMKFALLEISSIKIPRIK
jgi:hypothetical protein